MTDSRYDSIPARLMEQGRVRPSEPAYCVRDPSGSWVPTDWKTYAQEVRQVARALVTLGVEPGQTVTMLGFNRPEWVLMDVGAMTAGCIPAGIYTTCSPSEVQYIIDHSEAPIVLIEDEGQWEKIQQERERLPQLRYVVTMKGTSIDDPLCMDWETFLAKGDETPDAVVDERIDGLKKEGVGTLIYTSGTTGPPKAVMLSHENLSWTARTCGDMTTVGHGDITLSYLPLSHIAEQMFTIHIPISVGVTVYYARSMESVPEDLAEVRPTVFLGVPRVWEKMRAKIGAALDAATGTKAKLARWAMGVGVRAVNRKAKGQAVTGLLGVQQKAADKLVQSKIKARLGFDRLRVAVTGAAPISSDVLDFFAGLGITIHEVYGQSEGTGPTTFNFPGETKFGTVGRPIPGAEVTLGDDGEIRLRGPNVFMGYMKDDEATAATLDDGWLLSGDLGQFDNEGFLKIVGRKKEIIITAGGKNIAPKNIEAALKDLPLVSQAVVIGDRRPFIGALITLDPDAISAFQQEYGIDGAEAHDAPQVLDALQKGIDERVNPQFARVEQVRKFKVLPRDFAVDTGELTPSLKIKRRIVAKNFSSEIESIYS